MRYRYFKVSNKPDLIAEFEAILRARGQPNWTKTILGTNFVQYKVLLDEDTYGQLRDNYYSKISSSDKPFEVSEPSWRAPLPEDATLLNIAHEPILATTNLYTIPAGYEFQLLSANTGVMCGTATNILIRLQENSSGGWRNLIVAYASNSTGQTTNNYNPPLPFQAGVIFRTATTQPFGGGGTYDLASGITGFLIPV